MSEKLAEIHALWIGKSLGKISHCCLKSFIMRGHKVYLHVYEDIDDLPDGIMMVDANLTIPSSKIIKHKKTGSYALFSDIFRYELLKQKNDNTLYVDCDVYCLSPIIIPNHGYLLGFEDDKSINGAVLALPSESVLLGELLKAAYDPMFIPPWFSSSKQWRFKVKKKIGIGRGIEDMPWGIIGPAAITYYIKKLEIEDKVVSADVFYPVHYTKVRGYLNDPELSIVDLITSRTLCFHLYNEMLRDFDLNSVPEDSVLDKFLLGEI